MKKLVSSLAIAGMVLASSASAVAAPQAVDSTRSASPISAVEDLAGASSVWIIALFAAIAAGIVFAVEGGDDDADLPISP